MLLNFLYRLFSFFLMFKKNNLMSGVLRPVSLLIFVFQVLSITLTLNHWPFPNTVGDYMYEIFGYFSFSVSKTKPYHFLPLFFISLFLLLIFILCIIWSIYYSFSEKNMSKSLSMVCCIVCYLLVFLFYIPTTNAFTTSFSCLVDYENNNNSNDYADKIKDNIDVCNISLNRTNIKVLFTVIGSILFLFYSFLSFFYHFFIYNSNFNTCVSGCLFFYLFIYYYFIDFGSQNNYFFAVLHLLTNFLVFFASIFHRFFLVKYFYFCICLILKCYI
jgi:hypothetical protein